MTTHPNRSCPAVAAVPAALLAAVLAAVLAAPARVGAQQQVSPTSFASATVCAWSPGGWPASLHACYDVGVRTYTLLDDFDGDGVRELADVTTLRVATLQGRSPRDNTIWAALGRVRVSYDPALPSGAPTSVGLVGASPIGGATVDPFSIQWFVESYGSPPNPGVSAGEAYFSFGITGCGASPPPPWWDEWPGSSGSTCVPGSAVEFTWWRLDPPVVGAFDARFVRGFWVDGSAWDGSFQATPYGDLAMVGPVSCDYGCEYYDYRAGVIPLATLPEPAPAALFAVGALGIAAVVRRRGARPDGGITTS